MMYVNITLPCPETRLAALSDAVWNRDEFACRGLCSLAGLDVDRLRRGSLGNRLLIYRTLTNLQGLSCLPELQSMFRRSSGVPWNPGGQRGWGEAQWATKS